MELTKSEQNPHCQQKDPDSGMLRLGMGQHHRRLCRTGAALMSGKRGPVGFSAVETLISAADKRKKQEACFSGRACRTTEGGWPVCFSANMGLCREREREGGKKT